MTATTDLIDVAVPDIGDFDEVPVIEILVAVGDEVAAEDPLVTLESDKATMDVPAPAAGTVRELRVSVGDRVSEGSSLLVLAATGPERAGAAEEARPEEARAEEARPEEARAEEPARGPARVSGSETTPLYASPSVRRLARELGVSLEGLAGSGRKGRILKQDVTDWAGAGPPGGAAAHPAPGGTAAPPAPGGTAAPPAPGGALADGAPGLQTAAWPVVDFEKFGPVERVQRSRIQRISGPALHRNWVMIPHVTHTDEADITELEAWRKELNAEHARAEVKFTLVSFLVAACVATLRAFPAFNASLDGEELVLRRYYNIGFAADTPGGLVVPVIRQADEKGLREIATELAELSARARAGKLTPEDMSGSTFTISSLGGIGGTSFTPIINAPEVAILGVTRAAIKPVWDGGEFRPRLLVPLSLSYDHRVIDGAAAARFVVHLTGVLADLKRALL